MINNPVTFHVEVFMPDHVAIDADKMTRRLPRLRYGPHSLRAMANDRFGVIRPEELPTDLKGWELIEVEVYDGMPQKVVVRKKMRDGRWLVLVVGDDGFVRTLWSNRACDCHSTLRRDRYVPRPSDEHDCKNSTPVQH